MKWFSGCLNEEVYQWIMSWTKNKAISLPRMVVPASSSVRVSGAGIGRLGRVFVSSLSAFRNHPCWYLVRTARRCGAVHSSFLCSQTPLNPPPLQLSREVVKRFITFLLPILLSSVIPKMLQGPFTPIWIATFYLLLLTIKRKPHRGSSILTSWWEQE